MQDDFDNGMGMPDEELGGGSGMSDLADITGGGPEGDLLDDLGQPAGRPSGGARARKAAFVPRPRAAAKPAKKSAKKAAKRVVKKAAKKKGARKAKPARKGAKKRAGKKK